MPPPNEGMPPLNPGPGCVSPFEFLHPALFYVPVLLYAITLMARHRSITLPALANPSIFAGGAVGERKSDVFDLAGPYAAQFIAPNTTVLAQEERAQTFQACLEALKANDLGFPIVAKPDSGLRGAGVRPINCEDELRAYVNDFPVGQNIMLQKKVEHAGEVGVFYIRHPTEERGKIFSLTLKYTATIIGDGQKTIEELIDDCPRCRRMEGVYKERHAAVLNNVLKKDQVFPLNFAGSHARGSIFRNGQAYICDQLTDVFDGIAKDIDELYFARFDVRFKSLEALKQGRDFSIVEVNGVGAEATHIWDCDMGVKEAYQTLAAQWRHAFSIGAANKNRQHSLPGLWKILKIWAAEVSRADDYPLAH
ncbi:MAG: D-alanine--D-alanine ligase [Pseudomonadota bacterium]